MGRHFEAMPRDGLGVVLPPVLPSPLGLRGGLGPELVVNMWTPSSAAWTRSSASPHATLSYDATVNDVHVYTAIVPLVVGCMYLFNFRVLSVQDGKKAKLSFRPSGVEMTEITEYDVGVHTEIVASPTNGTIVRLYGYNTGSGGVFSVVVNSIRQVT